MKSYVVDICDREQMEEYFVGVDVVFHCAALVDFQFPPNMNDLERINVFGSSFPPHLKFLLVHSTNQINSIYFLL